MNGVRKKINTRKTKHVHLKKKMDSFSLFFTVFKNVAMVFVVFAISSLLFSFLTPKKSLCANSISCKTTPKFEIETNAIGTFNNKPVRVPNIFLAQNENVNPVLGVSTSQGERHIYVNLKTQILTAYEGKTLIMETPISSGLWGKTPTGDFTIWEKLRATRMSGGSGSDFYDLPNVPYVMFFENTDVSRTEGYSIHGTYWHNNFGHAMSHGCINMKTTDVAKLYEWADGPVGGKKGTLITIYGEEP